ncbi:MAG: hypothetical protein HY553_08055 [Elusimicrobia bacterium]|nr:hypothetical protein [Elusimicrobiota bacterium]
MTQELLQTLLTVALLACPAAAGTTQSTEHALSALEDGRDALGSRNASMPFAGRVLDGAGSRSLAAPLAPVSREPGLGEGGATFQGARDRYARAPKPAAAVQLPAAPPVAAEREATPYKGYMIAAIAALLLSILLMIMAGKLADQARAGSPALFPIAAAFHLAAAMMGALAVAMGVILMTAFRQTGQGLIFAAAGGILAVINIRKAYEGSEGAKQAENDAIEAARQRENAERFKTIGEMRGTLDPAPEPGGLSIAQQSSAYESFQNYQLPEFTHAHPVPPPAPTGALSAPSAPVAAPSIPVSEVVVEPAAKFNAFDMPGSSIYWKTGLPPK